MIAKCHATVAGKAINASVRALAVLVMVLSVSTAMAQVSPIQTRITGAFGWGYDDNLLSAQDNAEKEGAPFFSTLLAGDAVWIASNAVSLVLRGQVQSDLYARFNDLSNGKALLMVRANYKTGVGFFAPLLTGWASAAKLEYGSEIRSGEEFRGGALLTEQLSTQLSLRGELKGFHRRGEGQVFDLSGQSAVIGLAWLIDPQLTTTLSYEFQTGDSTASGTPTLRNTQVADALEPDDAFGGLARNQFAYRFDAQTYTVTAGFNYRLTPDLALDAQLQSVGVDGDSGNQYRRTLGVFGLVKRF